MKIKNNTIISANWTAKIFRVDGEVEEKVFHNLVVDSGMDFLAEYLSSTPGSAQNYIAVGTGSEVSSLGTIALVGESVRNAMATQLSSKNVWITTATFAGNTDGITSVALTEAAVFNASSGFNCFQRVNGVLATLGASDFLHLTIETTIGSRSS